MILHYKCPGCGSDMNFDPASGDLSCQSCGSHENIENFPEELVTAAFSEDETKEYHCENCGAVLLTLAETTATSCSFCGAGVVIADRLSGQLAPAKVIPFTISKEEAIKAFKKWCRKGLLTPKGFMNADRIKSITGMYVPFWLFDLNSKVQVNAECTKVRTYTSGEYIYTETKYYEAFRDIDLNYVKIPVDASEKMNDELMDKLEPYPYEQLKDFKTPYLAGYMAEKYNYTGDDLLPRAKEKISEYIESYISSTLSGYHSVHYHHKNIDTRNVKNDYVLLPVWMVSYDYNQSEHIFAMNGQTGKVVGKPPISTGKVITWFSCLAAGSLLVLKGVSFMMGGGFW
ncbi:TFIIB-type zinc ribbon-containing protein [Bacillus benzoevorans]|uniref:DNA-directed RNA polymerase subunit RPC12/RpoP n=1 Tax=Bacillus benzoevorans TaxID=1456 RepID=A0A7X0HV24_9BACI|nr:TFIIB-type zinc ribbon-containing protein [Bacillus benzoevorans]MBB6447427.1 DNA-directed RNA polymerase subunit RPC12/RpoP [Bacillus benzoevorans]